MKKNYDGDVSEAQAKGRQTKLSKKTNEELINIILRKDKTERLNSNQIKTLKAEINELQVSVTNLTRNVKDAAYKNISLNHDLGVAQDEKEVLSTDYNKKVEEYEVLSKKFKSLKKDALGMEERINRFKAKLDQKDDAIKTKDEVINGWKLRLNEMTDAFHAASKTIEENKRKINAYKVLCVVLLIAAILAIVF